MVVLKAGYKSSRCFTEWTESSSLSWGVFIWEKRRTAQDLMKLHHAWVESAAFRDFFTYDIIFPALLVNKECQCQSWRSYLSESLRVCLLKNIWVSQFLYPQLNSQGRQYHWRRNQYTSIEIGKVVFFLNNNCFCLMSVFQNRREMLNGITHQ